MKVSVKGFIYHKAAERFVDCFDRYGYNLSTNKFAISDGVSKSFFPDIWAELLVNDFIKKDDRIDLFNLNEYKNIQKEWIKKVGEIVAKPDQKYFVKNFFIQGRSAAATFVGLHFFKEGNILKWEAIALGDSFLFFVPENFVPENFNENKIFRLSSQNNLHFNNFPDFFDSRNPDNKGKIKQKNKDLKSGTFYLMTDALAEWFVYHPLNAIEIINNWKSQKDFQDSIDSLRKIDLTNDDCAILQIEIQENYINDIVYDKVDVTDYSELLRLEKEKMIVDAPIPESFDVEKKIYNSTFNDSLPELVKLDNYYSDNGEKKKDTGERKETKGVENNFLPDQIIIENEKKNSEKINIEFKINNKESESSFLNLIIRKVLAPFDIVYLHHKSKPKEFKNNIPSDSDVKSTTDKF